ncbi:MAG: sensor histidine kinase, partial [Oscillospiraceae bacterium]|jgi:two-component system sensor histidine kinase YesM|nr:sensor histidine kinase [Oscillospiraceae bacterium]
LKIKTKSLRGRVILLIILCWALPLLIMSITGSWYVLISQRQDIITNAEVENSHSAGMAVKTLDEAVSLSRNLSRVGTRLGSLYNIWLNGDTEARYSGVNALLNSLLRDNVSGSNRNYVMTGVVFFDSPDICYRLANPDWGGAGSFPAVLERIVSLSIGQDGRIRFYIEDGMIYMMRNLLDRKDFSPFGTVIFCMRAKQVFDGFLQSGEELRSIEYWLNGQYGYIGDEEQALRDDRLRRVRAERETEETISFEGLSLVSQGVSASSQDITARIFLRWNSNPLWHETQIFLTVYFAMIISTVVLLVGALLFFGRHITHPLDTLQGVSKKLEAGELGVQAAPFDKNLDFQQIISTFNSMSGELKNQFERIYNEELALKDAKIMALRSQINPHFLNNTLELMNWEAQLAGQQRISEMIGALSVLLDASLNRSDTREVSLREELGYADAFIFILSKRYGDRLHIEKSVERGLMSIPVPPLVIQPLLENAVQYGFERNREGTITLSVRQMGNHICIEVINLGELSEENRKKIQSLLSSAGETRGAHLGIRNVRERLMLLYGGEETFSITSDGGFTTARITLPIRR